jgi:hypothetical protein
MPGGEKRFRPITEMDLRLREGGRIRDAPTFVVVEPMLERLTPAALNSRDALVELPAVSHLRQLILGDGLGN